MNRRLIFFIGVYDTLDIFAFELQREFEGMGYETMLFDTADLQKSLGQLAAFVKKPVTAVITFNNLGYNMELTQGNNIWNDLDLFVVNILMDHPFCYKPALDASRGKPRYYVLIEITCVIFRGFIRRFRFRVICRMRGSPVAELHERSRKEGLMCCTQAACPEIM